MNYSPNFYCMDVGWWYVEAYHNTDPIHIPMLHAGQWGWVTEISKRICFKTKREAVAWLKGHQEFPSDESLKPTPPPSRNLLPSFQSSGLP